MLLLTQAHTGTPFLLTHAHTGTPFLAATTIQDFFEVWLLYCCDMEATTSKAKELTEQSVHARVQNIKEQIQNEISLRQS